MNQEMEKLKILLGQRDAIALRSIEKVDPRLLDFFIENANELNYYKCDHCNYYVRGDLFNHHTDLCKACHNKMMKEAQEIEKEWKGI